MKANVIEVIPEKCTGCRLCEMACSFHHNQECSTAKSRIKILQHSKWVFDCPLLCIQCVEAPCMESCPTQALSRDEATGVVVLNAEVCIGCGECLTACPLRALALDEERGTILKCDLCGGDPECVKWCPQEALILKEVDINSPARKAFAVKVSKYLEAVG